MGYPLSASRLQAYQRCPQSYYFQYERRMASAGTFGATNLGRALHHTLAQVYSQWHYGQPMPWDWVITHWHYCPIVLTPSERQDGAAILQRYYAAHLQGDMLRKPVAVEGKFQGSLFVNGIEFTLTGRYDRLDWYENA